MIGRIETDGLRIAGDGAVVVVLVLVSVAEAVKSHCVLRVELDSLGESPHCTTIIESGRAKPVARAQALMARGFGYVFQKDFDRALADFDAAIRNNPKLAAAYYYRGAIQMGCDPKRALADINKAISLNPRDPDYFRARDRKST